MTNSIISLGFSTCPNDTFMFDALVHGRIDTEGLTFEVKMGDIAELNQMAAAGELDMIKVSYNAYSRFKDDYHLLDAGSALGHDCGPLLITKDSITVDEIVNQNLPVAIPGKNTTANLLLDFFAPEIENRKEMIFHEVMPAILDGTVAAGVIIHENRFTYQDLGLGLIQDLGEYWESKTGLPIPLGAIVARRDLGEAMLEKLGRLMRKSVEHAFANPDASRAFVRSHAQEMDEEVMQAHIKLYVNEYSVSLGDNGRAAVAKLMEVAG